jgi:threonine synthase
VVLKGLASDGGLFIPEEIPQLPSDWKTKWSTLSFSELAFEILSLYISSSEIPSADLKTIIDQSYSTFRAPEITPVVTLDKKENLHLLELFHGPTFAFKDVALQTLGNLFEYFLVRKNKGLKEGEKRHHLTVIGATSGDTGSAAIYGLRGKKDVSVFILHPKGRVSPIQEAQMTTVLDANVHNLAVEGTFDDCQDTVKALFADPIINKTQNLGAVNSINWARILAQTTYYFHAYFSLARSLKVTDPKIRFVVPTGNFGDVLAGYFAKHMGLPVEKLVVATNENDILDRFWKSGRYEKQEKHGKAAEGGLVADGVKAAEEGVKETLSPAMDILVSSNFERLLWFLAYEVYGKGSVSEKRSIAGAKVNGWLQDLKLSGGFAVDPEVLKAASVDFESERVSDVETQQTIKDIYKLSKSSPTLALSGAALPGPYILDPHSAIGVAASLRSITRAPPPDIHHISLATAHPAKFANAVDLSLKGEEGFSFASVMPAEFEGLEKKEKRVTIVKRGEGWEGVRAIVEKQVAEELGVNRL